MPKFSLGRQSSLWLLSFPALLSFPCAIAKNTQVWIPLLPSSFNRLMSCWAWNLHCSWFYIETRAVSRSNAVLPVFRFAWDILSSCPDCSESLAFVSKDFILWNVEGHLFRKYKMIKDKVKLFYGRWGSAFWKVGNVEQHHTDQRAAWEPWAWCHPLCAKAGLLSPQRTSFALYITFCLCARVAWKDVS